MAEHTPGPWHWEGDNFKGEPEHCPHGTEWTNHGPDLIGLGGEVVISSDGYDASDLSVKAADAHLIAAAPRLLEALEAELLDVEYLRLSVSDEALTDAVKHKLAEGQVAARALIAEARGGQSSKEKEV